MALATLLTAGALGAQAVEPRTPVERTELGGRVNLQIAASSVDTVPQTEFIIRRARLWAATRINYWIDGAFQVDVGYEGVQARYAFMRFTVHPAFRVSLGQFKRAFDVFELTSSSRILVIERDGRVRGADACTGLGTICTYSGFSEDLLFSSLDIGALVDGELAGGRLRYLASVTNGPGKNRREENHTKSGSMRVEIEPVDWLVLGLNAAAHDFPSPVTGETGYAPAFALDLDLGSFEAGPHLQLGAMAGENWRNLDLAGAPSRFAALQGIATWRIPLASPAVTAVEPLARVSWGDPDIDVSPDSGYLFTPGLVLHFVGRNKIAANFDYWRPAAGPRVWSVKVQSYLYF